MRTRFYEWRFERYWWDADAAEWVRRSYALEKSYDAVHAMAARRAGELLLVRHGEASAFHYRRVLSFGTNEMNIKVEPVLLITLRTMVMPFNIFQ